MHCALAARFNTPHVSRICGEASRGQFIFIAGTVASFLSTRGILCMAPLDISAQDTTYKRKLHFV